MSNYLSKAVAFEEAVQRGKLHFRSKDLDALIAAVNNYTHAQTQGLIYDVRDKFNAWRDKNPKEFFDRGDKLAADFNAEVKAEFTRFGLSEDQFEPEEDDEAGQAEQHLPGAPAVAVNRWKKMKIGSKVLRQVADKGINAAQIGTGTGTKALILGTAAATSATGIGLVVAAGALQIGTTVLAVRSVKKTDTHLKNLMDMYNHRDTEEMKKCAYADWVANPAVEDPGTPETDHRHHDLVANQVLPYIIRQKAKKRKRKFVAGMPIVGAAEGVRALSVKAYKWKKGTLGKDRENAAGLLASHFLACDCVLSKALISELYSVEEMEWLRGREYKEVTDYLGRKLAST